MPSSRTWSTRPCAVSIGSSEPTLPAEVLEPPPQALRAMVEAARRSCTFTRHSFETICGCLSLPARLKPNNALKRSSEKSQIDQTKTGPNAPAARTELSTSSHMPRGASPESDRSSEGRTPILPNTPPALPELCSTPGSDDSFVEDYW